MPTKYAFDSTARTIDIDGRMHISRSHISKATVNPYIGREIPGWEALGLNPDKIYKMLRDPEELRKAAPTFARLPILSKHIPIKVFETLSEQEVKQFIVGAIGSDLEFSDPYLDADTSIWDAAAIAGIETDTVREFSCAYRYKPVMTPGTYKGEDYDGVMTEIRGNHLALVESGRAGGDVLAADSYPEGLMKKTKLGKALTVALGTAWPKLAQDSSLPTLVGGAKKATFDKSAVRTKLLAMDSSIPAEQLDVVMDALLDAAEPEPKDGKKPAADKGARDNKPEGAEDEEDDEEEETAEDKEEEHPKDCDCKDCKSGKKPAMDSKKAIGIAMDAFKVELREADEARRAVRDVIGEVIAQDSAAEIYGLALDHMKVGRADVTGVPALKALFELASSHRASVSATSSPRIAQDAAGLASKFPGATRFRQG